MVLRKLFDRYYAEAAEEGSFLFPAVADTLGALHAKGLPLALVTNKPTPFVAPILDALDIAKYFTVVIGGDDVKNKKNPIRIPCCLWRRSWAWRLLSCCSLVIRVMISRRLKPRAAAPSG